MENPAVNENPVINFEEASRITGGISLFFYCMLFLYPYGNFIRKNYCNLKGLNWTLSNSLKNCDKMIEIILIMNFMYFMMWFFAYRGTLFNIDSRLACPLSMWLFGLSITSILWIFADRKGQHSFLAFMILLSGQIFAFITMSIYKDVIPDTEEMKAFESIVWTSFGIGVLLCAIFGMYKILNIDIIKSNYLAFFEFLHFILIGVALSMFIFVLPPLPSMGVIQLPFSKEEILDTN